MRGLRDLAHPKGKGVLAILLTQVNVWLDVIFTTVWVIVLFGFFVVHLFVLGIPSGRFKKKWFLHEWPKHDWAPPALPKFMHFQHLAMMALLAFSGMYIRFPFFDGGRTAMRYLHYVAAVIVGFNYFWRLWYAFFSKERDYKEFAITKKDLQSMLGVAMYYFYLSNKKPHVAKYNVMQKITYDLFAVLMLAQGVTGIALLTQPILFGLSPREVLLGWLPGSVAIAGAWVRIIHYSINWVFIILVTVHMYLAVAEDLPCSLDFFGIKKLTVYPDAYAHHDEEHGAAGALTPAHAEGD